MSRPLDSQDAARLYGRWYYDTYNVAQGVAHGCHDPHWARFFGAVADQIVAALNPKTVLDAGCANGRLVLALRERGVEASGFDLSEYAISLAPEAARPHLRVASLLDPIEGSYDLVTCIEVLEHLDPADSPSAVSNLVSAGDRVLFSSAPDDFREPTHTASRPPERWAEMFAERGMFRADHDAGYLSPWAVLFERREPTLRELARDHERLIARLQREVVDQRASLLNLQLELERLAAQPTARPARDERVTELQMEVLRLRDRVVGAQAERATALGRVSELEGLIGRYEAALEHYEHMRRAYDDAQQHLAQRRAALEHYEAVLASRSWRVSQKALTPLRWLRARRARR